MDADAPSPGKPGWYWDPSELEVNRELRERWRRELMVLDADNVFRLRRWDGSSWTDDTLRQYQARGVSSLPYSVGPTTRMYPITPEQAKRRLKLWAVGMILATLGAVIYELLK